MPGDIARHKHLAGRKGRSDVRGDSEPGDGCLELRSGRKVILATPALLDISAARAASEHLLSAIDRGTRLVIFDMSATVICDYAGVGLIVNACTRAVEAGTEIRLIAVNHLVRRLMRVSDPAHLVCVFSSLPDAISSPASARAPAPPGPAMSRPQAP